VVGTISVTGNVTVDSARIVRSFEVVPGSRFSADAVRRGIRKLIALGLFDDVSIDQVEHADRIDLVVHVKERPRIGEIRFIGNKKRDTDDLEKKLFLHVEHPYNPAQVPTQIDSLLQYYHDQGFPRAHITSDAQPDSATGRIRLHFLVSEGERVRITRIEFAGLRAFPAKKLKKQLATKARGWFGGGDFKDETFAADEEKLDSYYRNHGYRDAHVTAHELKPGAKPRDLTLLFTLEEGPRYQIGNISWSGNVVVPSATLEKLWQPRAGEIYDQSKIQKIQGLAYAEYAEIGYLYLNVDPHETVNGQKVDVAFAITEGAPSKVRMIQIAGNLGTREKVIRREIDIHEGDRFKRSALVRSQGDIMRLGFFEDVQLDFAPADSSDVDLSIKVKEKQVGTASAGAGYTAQSGVTGFIELGHNNVLGNGQSLSLHLERGAKRSEYYLSFTEPWFRDTPTLLSSSVFNTNRELDLYTEKRAGASGRIGRPLPWPDFSRGSIGYSLEDVTIKIDKPDSLFTAQDSIVLRGLRNGEPILTSSVNLNFLRNSANNPFYPTGGSRFSIESEVAGGPFGGSVNFHKHRVEGKLYFPSLLKGVTTMVRGRVGLIGEYADQNLPVPPYERFRLGGGTTPDPLRGYDDYMVVPQKFVRSVMNLVRRTVTDSLGQPSTVTDTSFSLVRYPGGRFMTLFTVEQQFPIAHPLHGVIFFDAGNAWDQLREIRPLDLRIGAGAGIRLEIPLLGNIGFDYGYGFDRRDLGDKPKFVGHFLIGQTSF
jgi:outer membrane protein insertion porin family